MKITNFQILQLFAVLFIVFFASQQQIGIEGHRHKYPSHCKHPCYNETKESPCGEDGTISSNS